jgi:ABC-type sugar transport system ATPase subunit
VQIGIPEQIWRQPADTFVARALGQPEINLLDGVVDDGRIRLGNGSFDVPVPVPISLVDHSVLFYFPEVHVRPEALNSEIGRNDSASGDTGRQSRWTIDRQLASIQGGKNEAHRFCCAEDTPGAHQVCRL